eukprot:COSAG01_NODE_2793_length_7060_cov_5.562563_9_plen_152_part_00
MAALPAASVAVPALCGWLYEERQPRGGRAPQLRWAPRSTDNRPAQLTIVERSTPRSAISCRRSHCLARFADPEQAAVFHVAIMVRRPRADITSPQRTARTPDALAHPTRHQVGCISLGLGLLSTFFTPPATLWGLDAALVKSLTVALVSSI